MFAQRPLLICLPLVEQCPSHRPYLPVRQLREAEVLHNRQRQVARVALRHLLRAGYHSLVLLPAKPRLRQLLLVRLLRLLRLLQQLRLLRLLKLVLLPSQLPLQPHQPFAVMKEIALVSTVTKIIAFTRHLMKLPVPQISVLSKSQKMPLGRYPNLAAELGSVFVRKKFLIKSKCAVQNLNVITKTSNAHVRQDL